MNTNKIIGIILIITSLFLGYTGINKISESSVSVKLLDLKLDMSDNSGKEEGYIYLGLAVILFGGGLYMVKRTK
tara:strand:- start:1527 stop:1748 length:222 start_codon:yes stop_codon:yes gene_type:complete